MASVPRPLRIFWSYSHKDGDLRDQLDSHLSALKRAQRVEAWHDRKILAGADWRAQIGRELESADIVLLLVSANFLNSDFCHEVELKHALERHARGEALVIPIMLRPCDVEGSPIAGLEQLPEDGRPITKWGNRDEACKDVARRLRVAVEEWNARTPARAPAAPAAATPAPAPAPAPSAASPAKVLNRIFGLGETVNQHWLQTVQDRGRAVARIDTVDGHRVGTGFLVPPEAFGLRAGPGPLLLTCSHVAWPPGPSKSEATRGKPPGELVVHFQMTDVVRRIASFVWAPPGADLYSVLVTLDGPVPGAEPIPIASELPSLGTGRAQRSRVVLISHPLGGELEFSLQDTVLMDANDQRLHYRAGTAPGSSGGPVLSGTELQCLAIHNARNDRMPRLHGQPGTYEACEGISLVAICDAVRKSGPTLPAMDR